MGSCGPTFAPALLRKTSERELGCDSRDLLDPSSLLATARTTRDIRLKRAPADSFSCLLSRLSRSSGESRLKYATTAAIIDVTQPTQNGAVRPNCARAEPIGGPKRKAIEVIAPRPAIKRARSSFGTISAT